MSTFVRFSHPPGRSQAIAAVLAAVVALGTVAGTANGAEGRAEVRITVQRLQDGRTELALQVRGTDGAWGDRLLPAQRFVSADAAVGRWHASSPLTVRPSGASGGTTPLAVRITAQRLDDGATEFALQVRGTDGAWGDRLLPARRSVSASPPVGPWLASSPLTVQAPTPGQDGAQRTPTATIDVRVWQDVHNERSLYVSARPAHGSWARVGTIPLPLDDGSSFAGRYRYGELALDFPSPSGPATRVEVRVSQAIKNTRTIHVGARESGGSWLRLGTIGLALDDGSSPTGRFRYGDITIAVPLADSTLLDACSNGIAVPDPEDNGALVQDCVTLLEARDVLVGEEETPMPAQSMERPVPESTNIVFLPGDEDDAEPPTSTWSADRPVAEWTGVTVAGSPPRVIEITLAEAFRGRVPPGLARLDRLRALNLWSNGLTGEIPRELSLLSDLEVLDVSWEWEGGVDSAVTGRIPPEFGDLRNLRDLKLVWNQLEGEIPREVAALPNLRSVDLAANRLTGEIPPEFGRPNLRVLSLSANLLAGEIPEALAAAVHLEELTLHANRLTGRIPPEFGNLAELREISLHNNQFSGCIPVALWDKLAKPWYGDRSGATTIDLPWCDAVALAASLPPLDQPLVAACASDGAVPEPEQHPGLVNDCAALLQARDTLDGGARVLNWNSETPIEDWAGISVWSGRVDGLRPSGEGLAGQVPAVLAHLTHLEVLDLEDNRLTGGIPPELAQLERLESLRLSSNQLTGEIPPVLGAFASLQGLSLSGNQLSGPIPPELGRLQAGFGLADNQLSGEIPEELARSGSVALDVSGNQLTGSIPLAFAEIAEFSPLDVWLRLGGNEISGCLPLVLAPFVEDREELRLPYCECPAPWWRSSGYNPDLTLDADGIPYMPDRPNRKPGLYRITLEVVVDLPDGGEFSLGPRYRDDTGRILVRIAEEETFSSLVLDPFTGEEIERTTFEGPPDCDVTVSDLFDSIIESARVQPVAAIPSRNGLPTLRLLQPVEGPGTYNIRSWGNLVVDVPDGMRLTLEWGDRVCTRPGGCFSTLHLRDEESGSVLAIDLTGEEYSRDVIDAGDGRDAGMLFDRIVASIRQRPPPFPEPSCDAPPTAADCAILREVAGTLAVSGALNWNAGWQLADWDGVRVDPWTGRIIELDLSWYALGGRIPPMLGELSELEVLDLSGNGLSGGIPSELGRLSDLRVLALSTNNLTGAIPAEVGALTSLEELNLYGNQLAGEIPAVLGELPRLQRLNLYGNWLEGCIPAGLARFDITIHGFTNPGLRRCTEGS